MGVGVYCFHVVRHSITFWILLLILLNNLRNLFVFCITVDIDKLLLLHKHKGLGLIFWSYFPSKLLKRRFGFCFLSC